MLRPEKGQKIGQNAIATGVVFLSRFDHESDWLLSLHQGVFHSSLRVLIDPEKPEHCVMEISKTRSVSSTVVFSSIFLSVVCLSGLIHVEIELHVHRQMLQVLNQQREEKIPLRNTAQEDKESVMKMLSSDIEKGK